MAGHVPILDLLVEMKADPNLLVKLEPTEFWPEGEWFGGTWPMVLAASGGHVEVVGRLHKLNANKEHS